MTNSDDLQPWHLIYEIAAEDAALLMIGVNPTRVDISEAERGSARVYEKAIREAVARADFFAWQRCDDREVEELPLSPDIWEMEPDFERYLPTFEMRGSVGDVLRDPENVAVLLGGDPWYSATIYGGDFRAWLKRNGVQSRYVFQDEQAIVVTKLNSRAVIDAERKLHGLPSFDDELKYAATEQAVAKVLTPERPLGTRERNTLLCMIAALCKDVGYDYAKSAKTAGLILSTSTKMGMSLGETTIEGHLKKITNAVATRTR